MAAKGVILRYKLIIEKIKQQTYISLNELLDYVENKIEYYRDVDDQLIIGYSRRTLLRDFKDIDSLFGVAITYSHQHKGYFIEDNIFDNSNFQRLLDEFQIYNSLQFVDKLKPVIQFEEYRKKNFEFFLDILYAIKNHYIGKFTYQFFDIDDVYEVECEPYGMKEFKSRWYLIAKHYKDDFVKTFALDRMLDFSVTGQNFTIKQKFDINKFFGSSFGIHVLFDEEPMNVVLSFKALQARYVKIKPLHFSQKILKDSKDELIVSLFVQNTFDFRMELLSYGSAVKVLEPENLKKQLIEIYLKAAEQYKI